MKCAVPCEVDVITSADLPELRESMMGYAADDCFSSELRGVCRDVAAAIDQARDADVSTHASLKRALEKFVLVGQREVLLHAPAWGMWPC